MNTTTTTTVQTGFYPRWCLPRLQGSVPGNTLAEAGVSQAFVSVPLFGLWSAFSVTRYRCDSRDQPYFSSQLVSPPTHTGGQRHPMSHLHPSAWHPIRTTGRQEPPCMFCVGGRGAECNLNVPCKQGTDKAFTTPQTSVVGDVQTESRAELTTTIALHTRNSAGCRCRVDTANARKPFDDY